ncbi:MAG: hypothetical protein HC906_19965 [Bacteroidales bacterium]|nr:hypothetical protein [Bacteroidales bacterium]
MDHISKISGGISDIAYDHLRNRFFISSSDRLKTFENGILKTLETPKHQYNGHRIGTVAIDPVEPNIIYAGTHGDVFTANNSIIRSTDGGLTWVNLHGNTPLPDFETVYPHEGHWIRVHPVTREAWVSGQCFGMWKMDAPQYGCSNDSIEIEINLSEKIGLQQRGATKYEYSRFATP